KCVQSTFHKCTILRTRYKSAFREGGALLKHVKSGLGSGQVATILRLPAKTHLAKCEMSKLLYNAKMLKRKIAKTAKTAKTYITKFLHSFSAVNYKILI